MDSGFQPMALNLILSKVSRIMLTRAASHGDKYLKVNPEPIAQRYFPKQLFLDFFATCTGKYQHWSFCF